MLCSMFVDGVCFVKENVILFQILKQYYIHEIKWYNGKRIPLQSVVSTDFVLWLNSKKQEAALHQLFGN